MIRRKHKITIGATQRGRISFMLFCLLPLFLFIVSFQPSHFSFHRYLMNMAFWSSLDAISQIILRLPDFMMAQSFIIFVWIVVTFNSKLTSPEVIWMPLKIISLGSYPCVEISSSSWQRTSFLFLAWVKQSRKSSGLEWTVVFSL